MLPFTAKCFSVCGWNEAVPSLAPRQLFDGAGRVEDVDVVHLCFKRAGESVDRFFNPWILRLLQDFWLWMGPSVQNFLTFVGVVDIRVLSLGCRNYVVRRTGPVSRFYLSVSDCPHRVLFGVLVGQAKSCHVARLVHVRRRSELLWGVSESLDQLFFALGTASLLHQLYLFLCEIHSQVFKSIPGQWLMRWFFVWSAWHKVIVLCNLLYRCKVVIFCLLSCSKLLWLLDRRHVVLEHLLFVRKPGLLWIGKEIVIKVSYLHIYLRLGR